MVSFLSKELKIIRVVFILLGILYFILSIPFLEIITAVDKKGYSKIENFEGAKVVEVIPNSPASKAGLKSEDIIYEVNGDKINSIDDYLNIVNLNKGKQINIKLLRNGNQYNYQLTPRTVDSESEGSTGVLITNEKFVNEDVSLPLRILNASIKPYLGFASYANNNIATGNPVGIYQATVAATSDYYILEYIGDFSRLFQLLLSIALILTAIGIGKSKKFVIYSIVPIIGVKLYSIFREVVIIPQLMGHFLLFISILGIITINILIIYMCIYVFKQRKYFN